MMTRWTKAHLADALRRHFERLREGDGHTSMLRLLEAQQASYLLTKPIQEEIYNLSFRLDNVQEEIEDLVEAIMAELEEPGKFPGLIKE